MKTLPLVSISIVSHAQGNLLAKIIEDLVRLCSGTRIEVFLTKNVPEPLPFDADALPFPVIVIENHAPKGFGANHNAAFDCARGEWFCVMNPDIRLFDNPFPALFEEAARLAAAVVAPAVLNPARQIDDSIRRFPTPLTLAAKMLRLGDGRYPFAVNDESFSADWVAGMFMLFRADDYRALGGFDENFFLYYEDVDICARLWKADKTVLACPKVQVEHDARRASRKNVRHMKWHLASMARYFLKRWGVLKIYPPLCESTPAMRARSGSKADTISNQNPLL